MRKYTVKNIPLDNPSLMLGETLFHNANGYIGIRGNFEEAYPSDYDSIRGQYINGFYDFAEMPQAEKLYGLIEEKQTMVNVVDTQGIQFTIDGETFSMFEGTILESSRTLDMDLGVTIREITWQSPNGKKVAIKIQRMTSFSILPLFLIDFAVTPLNFSGEISFYSTHKGDVKNYFNPKDPRVAGESLEHLVNHNSKTLSSKLLDSFSLVTAHTAKSDLTVCTGVTHAVLFENPSKKNDVENTFKKEQLQPTENFQEGEKITLHSNKNQTIRLLKYTIICDSIRYGENLQEQVQALLESTIQTDITDLYQSQKDILAKFWNSCEVKIIGDEELNQAVSYNLYQLMQSVGKDPHSNIAAKGLSGEGYEGHYFWDTEMYIQPFFTLTSREISKNLIRYRYTILDHAKENAKLLGHKKGAAYTWRTIMGKECSGFFPAGSAQYHISGDIVYAIVKYYLATKDLEIIKECGAEIAIEVARMWMDLGNYYQGTFRLNEVTGPDEYTCLVNNNYYTNALAKFGLAWTVKFIKLLEKENLTTDLLEKTKLTDEELLEFKKA